MHSFENFVKCLYDLLLAEKNSSPSSLYKSAFEVSLITPVIERAAIYGAFSRVFWSECYRKVSQKILLSTSIFISPKCKHLFFSWKTQNQDKIYV